MEHVASSTMFWWLVGMAERFLSRPASSSLRFLEAPSSFSEAGHCCASSPVVRAGVFWLLMGIVIPLRCGSVLVLLRFRHAGVQGGEHGILGACFFFLRVSLSLLCVCRFHPAPSSPLCSAGLPFQFSWLLSQLDTLSSCVFCA